MPTVIDSLVLELGLDPKQFSQGAAQAVDSLRRMENESERAGKNFEAGGRKVNDVFTSLKREALGFLALFLGGRGIKDFVGYVTNLDAATARTARTLDMSTRELSAWQGAAEQAGGTAETITGSLQGLTGEMNRFMLTGQSTMLPVLNRMGIGLFDANKQLKTSGQLLLELADAVQGMDPARANAFLSMIPGMNPQTVNMLLEGRRAVEAYLDAARKAGGTTEESAAAARKYQQELAQLDRSATSLGRSLVTTLAPALTTIMDKMTQLLSAWNTPADSPQGHEMGMQSRAQMSARLGRPRQFMEWIRDKTSINDEDKGKWDAIINRLYANDSPGRAHFGAMLRAHNSTAANAPAQSAAEMEAYIRKAAASRGIDPDVAVRVAKSEGLYNYTGDLGSSFGPFQLHYGGIAPGGMAGKGLGDEFTKQTGLDARNSSTWKAQVDFSLDRARKSGWGPWHGWTGLPFAGIGGLPTGAGAAARNAGGMPGGGSTSSSTTTIGQIVVNTQASDAGAIARDIRPAMERGAKAAQANNGLQ